MPDQDDPMALDEEGREPMGWNRVGDQWVPYYESTPEMEMKFYARSEPRRVVRRAPDSQVSKPFKR